MRVTGYPNSKDGEVLLRVNNIRLDFHTYAGDVKALDGVTFEVMKGEALGLVGESGCGKSVTALTIVGLLPENASITEGQILLERQDLLKIDPEEMRKVRANKIAIAFQDPTTFLNPVLTIGQQLEEIFVLTSHPSGLKKDARLLSIKVLSQVSLPDPERILEQYPHELSGGMKQRCMIAMALARNPEVFIADEITTALDVTVQAQILELLRELKRELLSSTVLITHDLGIVAELCDRVAVMYAGNVVEIADVNELFANPLHPYTKGLMRAIPIIGRRLERLETIPGSVPDLIHPPSGCRFHPRCSFAMEKCRLQKPELTHMGQRHSVACHL